jgi:hypothetical protein
MTKRMRTTKTRKRPIISKKHATTKTHRRIVKSKTKKLRKRGGMLRALKNAVSSVFQPSPLVYADIDFVKKLRPLLSNKNNAANKVDAVKKLMIENKDQLNNVIWVTTGGRYTIHDPNNRVSGGTPMLLLQILLNVPEFKNDRSIYHVFLDNGGDIDKKTNPNGLSLKEQIAFDTTDDRPGKKGKKAKKSKKSVPKEKQQPIPQENVDDEGPIESVVEEEPVHVQLEEDVVKSDVESMPEQPAALPVATGPSYDTTLTFWKPLFPGTELNDLKTKFDSLIAGDLSIKHDEICKLCQFLKTIIPSFHVSFESVKNINGLVVFKQPRDIQNTNIILCATMILLGIIAKKLEKQDYTFMFKGGKGVQLAFAHAERKDGKKYGEYESEDIDLIIIPNKKGVSYDADKAKDLALNISYLIRWFFETNYKDNLDSQIMATNPNVVKFAYQAFMRDDKTPLGNKLALMDIDFSKIPDENIPFYKDKIKMFHKKTNDDGLSEDMLFYFQSLKQQIDEKLYYYLLYTKYKKMLQSRPAIEITDEKYKTLTVNECKYFLKKFKKSLGALLRGYGEGYLSFFDKYKTDSRFSEPLVDEVQVELSK